MALLCVYATSFGQKINIEPYYIGDRVSDLPLNKVVNYKDSIATLSSFGDKLLILDFWGTHCGSCIKMFPAENSLQRTFKNDAQFILVTSDDSATVCDFLDHYNKTHAKFSLPIVTSDILIARMFRFHSMPHYLWIAPDGTLLAQTSEAMVNKPTISMVLANIRKDKAHLQSEHFLENYFHFPAMDKSQSDFFYDHQN